jgi:GTPase SAR1 family protein
MLLDPARGNNFFGRGELLELLKKRVDGLRYGYRQNIAIIGPPYYGKTSVIYRFMDSLSFKDVIPVYIEVKPHGFPNFAEKFISTLLFKYLTNIEYKIEDATELMPVASERMPKTVRAIKAIEALIKAGKISQAYSAIFELPAMAHAETSLYPLIILDEFHRIGDFGINNAFAILGKYIMVQKDTMYIVTSSQMNQAREILSEKLSLLFGNFETCALETFDASTAVDFINFRLCTNNLPRQFINFLVAFTGGHPFYLDSILLNLDDNLNATSKDNQVDAITKTFAEILFDSKGILNQHFANVVSELEKLDERYIPVLLALANGNRKIQAISAASRLKTAELRPLLDRLIDFGWAVKHGVFYLVRDKVFEFWLRNVHQNKEYLLDLGYEPKVSKFNLEIKECLNKYAEVSKQDYIRRLSELFISFDGELVEIGRRSFKFPGFKTADVRHTGRGGVSCLLLSGPGCLWAFLIGLTPLKESDITDFLDYCKQQNRDIKRKIIVSPSEMDANTKLIAKEAKMWIWSLKELNELVDIAGKQRMVLFDLAKAVSREAAAGDIDKRETA